MIANPVQAAEQDPSFACLAELGPIEVIDGFYNDGKLMPSVEADKKFDARGASFEYPETISHSMVSVGDKGGSGAHDMCWAGGFFTASLSWHNLDISWFESKHGSDGDSGEMENTTAVTSYEDRMTWTGLNVYNMHDGIRTTNTYNNWIIQHVWLDYIRDDCVENDSNYSGTIYDVLFDGCYTGVSNQSGDGTGETITMDKVLLRMEPMPYPYKWDTKDDPVVYVDGYDGVPFGHGSTFKGDASRFPQLSITNSVFLQEYDSGKTIFPPPRKVITCENNTIIWLDGSATAPTYLLDDFPGCFTIITDYSEGKTFWKEKVADWHARHPEVGLERKPADPGEYSWPRYPSSGSGSGNSTPNAVFSVSCVDLRCNFDGSGSTDDGGTIQRYGWDFGDGSAGSSAKASHDYASGGTYGVILTVTDNNGAADTDAQPVSVTASTDTKMHVGDLDGSSSNEGGTWTAAVTVFVHDSAHKPVGGAVVRGSWSGGILDSATCTTDSGGACPASLSGIRKRDHAVTFTVTAVESKSNPDYTASENHDPDGDSNGTSIEVGKP